MKTEKEPRYRLELTRSQLALISRCVEDCSRFAASQTGMWHTVMVAAPPDKSAEIHKKLGEIHDLIAPNLAGSPVASYGWDGYGCPDKYQAKFIAATYYLYREILHRLTIDDGTQTWSVYNGETLRCDNSGPVIKIERITE